MRSGSVSKVFHHLTASIGPRPATSLEEAQAAAYVDGRFRHAGMQVSVDPFLASPTPPPTIPALILACILASVLVQWIPLPSLLLVLWLFIFTLIEFAGFSIPGPVFWPRSSQNIVATRAAQSRKPFWRIVLLSALDTPQRTGAGWCRGTSRQMILIRILLASAAVMALGLLEELAGFDRILIWPGQEEIRITLTSLILLLQVVIACSLLLSLWPLPARRDPTIGASGALAVLQRVSELIPSLRRVEVWGVGVGATTTGYAGVRDMLARYPFPRTETLFLTLECIAGGVPVCVSHEGAVRQWRADPLLLDLAKQIQASSTDPIAIRPQAAPTTLALPLHRGGYRVLALLSDGPSKSHSISQKDLQESIEQTSRLVVEIIRHLDREEKGTEGESSVLDYRGLR